MSVNKDDQKLFVIKSVLHRVQRPESKKFQPCCIDRGYNFFGPTTRQQH